MYNQFILTTLEEKLSEQEKCSAAKQLYFWQRSPNPEWFTAQLFSLFCRADALNQQKLGKGFPAEYWAFLEWNNHENGDDFFNKYLKD